MQKVYGKLLNIVRLVLYSNDAVVLIFVHQQNERVSSLCTFVNPRSDGSKQNRQLYANSISHQWGETRLDVLSLG